MEDAIPLIFQQLPATTGFVQNCGHFFQKPYLSGPDWVTGERKERREEEKGRSDTLRFKNEFTLATYLNIWEFFNINNFF